MREPRRLKAAIQKSGRLADKSLALLAKCGVEFDLRPDRLFHSCREFPIDLMLVRDDDIPEYVADGVCDLGIVGENVTRERLTCATGRSGEQIRTLAALSFGHCRLSLAVPESSAASDVRALAGKRVATSYPNCLQTYFRERNIEAQVVELSGSVEIAPKLGVADAVCDLVSSGGTLRSNGLREIETLFESQALLIRNGQVLDDSAEASIDRLLKRVRGVMKASKAKYIMMNAPASALDQIRGIIPGLEEPSVMALGKDGTKIAIHAVASEEIFWDTLESLKAVGASSILVLPIEKVVE